MNITADTLKDLAVVASFAASPRGRKPAFATVGIAISGGVLTAVATDTYIAARYLGRAEGDTDGVYRDVVYDAQAIITASKLFKSGTIHLGPGELSSYGTTVSAVPLGASEARVTALFDRARDTPPVADETPAISVTALAKMAKLPKRHALSFRDAGKFVYAVTHDDTFEFVSVPARP